MFPRMVRRIVRGSVIGAVSMCHVTTMMAEEAEDDWGSLENQFRTLPMEARRLTGPLFWLHGDESPELLQGYLEKVAEGGNGCFTAESRPHSDWLGPGWYRDLEICLRKAKELDLRMWIFDERWWPSGEVAGNVPRRYASKYIQMAEHRINGPQSVDIEAAEGHLIAVLAGLRTENGVLGDSLIDLTGRVDDGRVRWRAPEGAWTVIVFTWEPAERRGGYLVDGASRDAVDWYIRTVYQPHYDRFADEFGRTIVGYFYDEPETHGDWGTEVFPLLQERGVDWKKALVAWKLRLEGPEQAAAKYAYRDALAEAWGRTLYGGISAWCGEHGVTSIGHFLEHNREYLHPRLCAGNMFQLQKYTDMGGIDAVFAQFVPGQKDDSTYQTPKLGSSISHVYGKADDLSMVEIFGARGQDLTYPEMKWWTDHMHAGGINFHIPHSFNPRSPNDFDCPPYFYNGGEEPRWPLYRVYADYTSRLSLLLTGGGHVCPVALLFAGNSVHVGEATTPEALTTSLQDALFDCDWVPYDAFVDNTRIAGRELRLHQERYRVLIVPAVEVIPFEVLAKAREFFDAGGTVIGYGRLPSASATLGRGGADIAELRRTIWGHEPEAGLSVCRTSAAGGRSYFLPEAPTPDEVRAVLAGDAGIRPSLDVVEGETADWVHVLHREKVGRDVFFVTNLDHVGAAKRLRFSAAAGGAPEIWDAMRNEISRIPWERTSDGRTEFTLTLQPLESVLIVFSEDRGARPARLGPDVDAPAGQIQVARMPIEAPEAQPEQEGLSLDGMSWVWVDEGDPARSAPPGTRYFRARLTIARDAAVREGAIRLTADNDFVLYINGVEAGRGAGGHYGWQSPQTIDLTPHLSNGVNILAVAATNATDAPSPAGLIGRYRIVLADGREVTGQIDGAWKAAPDPAPGWNEPAFDDSGWAPARVVGRYGDAPWGKLFGAKTVSPVVADRFLGRFTVPADWFGGGRRIILDMEGVGPEEAAAVRLNGAFAGGFIGRPLRLDVTGGVRTGENEIAIEPFAPESVRLLLVRE